MTTIERTADTMPEGVYLKISCQYRSNLSIFIVADDENIEYHYQELYFEDMDSFARDDCSDDDDDEHGDRTPHAGPHHRRSEDGEQGYRARLSLYKPVNCVYSARQAHARWRHQRGH